MSKINYKGVDPEAIIDIQVSGFFYKQIVNALLALGDTRKPEEFKEALESLKTDKPAKDAFEICVRTLTSLIYEIETKAQAQDKLKEFEVDAPKPVTESSN